MKKDNENLRTTKENNLSENTGKTICIMSLIMDFNSNGVKYMHANRHFIVPFFYNIIFVE